MLAIDEELNPLSGHRVYVAGRDINLGERITEEYGFEKMEAYQVVSQAGHSRIANVVDPNYTIMAKFPKKLLPPKPGKNEDR